MPPLKTCRNNIKNKYEFSCCSTCNDDNQQRQQQLQNSTAGAGSSSSSSDSSTSTAASNETTTITTGLTSNNERRPYISTQYPNKVLKNLNLLRENSQFCDVEIIAGNVRFSAHRAVLSAASEYFEAMFRPDFGLCENKQKSVIIHTIDAEILNNLLDFIYTGKIDISQSNVQELLAAADMLQLHEVVDGCCEFLRCELHVTNALGILRFAEAHNCKILAKAALDFIYSNFPGVS